MGLLISIIIGGIIGWLASLIMKTDAQMGIIANIVVGIVGSALGHFLAGALGLAAYGMPARLIVSVIGAVLLIVHPARRSASSTKARALRPAGRPPPRRCAPSRGRPPRGPGGRVRPGAPAWCRSRGCRRPAPW